MLRRTWGRTQHVEEMSDEHKRCCDGHEAEHNMSKRCQMNTKDVAIGTFGKLKTVLKAWFKGKSRGEQSKFSFFCSTNKRKRTLIQQNGWMCVVKNKENVSVIFLWILPMWSSPKLLGWSSPFVFLFSFIFWWRHRGKYKIFKRKEKKKEKKRKKRKKKEKKEKREKKREKRKREKLRIMYWFSKLKWDSIHQNQITH